LENYSRVKFSIKNISHGKEKISSNTLRTELLSANAGKIYRLEANESRLAVFPIHYNQRKNADYGEKALISNTNVYHFLVALFIRKKQEKPYRFYTFHRSFSRLGKYGRWDYWLRK